ncbi:MAG: 2-C-methyl-D-erythritol 4-phosphate cytidylyltransferase [Chitinophagaceae bacterium]
MKKFGVIVAGGSGTRMGSEIPKQFLQLKGKSIIYHSINAFFNAFENIHIIIVLPKAHIETGRKLQAQFPNKTLSIVEGGLTRFDSVKNGLQLVEKDSIVFVHDAVRCLVSIEVIKRCYKQAFLKGSAIPAVAATDSIRIMTSDETSEVADRNKVRIVQTPQTFVSNLLLPVFEQPYNESFTDEASVVEYAGKAVYLVEGCYSNIKITRPIDLILAEKIMEERDAVTEKSN